MNKYLKILMLSGGLVGTIAPTAIDMDKKPNSDLGYIYDNIERMQEAIPKLSRINYKLNIDLDNNNKDITDNTSNLASDNNVDNTTNDTITPNDINDNYSNNVGDNIVNDNADNSIADNNSSNSDVSFITTDENGEETTLNNQETLNYLNETLIQTNIEYEALKTTLSNAIKDTMDYLDDYKNGETTLTNEQKIYIKEHTNSIKFLAETLEDLSEDVICCIDGCEDCADEDEFASATSKYLTTINDLETRINALNNAIASLQFINNIGNPYFFAGRITPNQGYGYYGYQHNIDNSINDENVDYSSNNENNLNNSNTSVEVDNDNLNSTDSVDTDTSTQNNDMSDNIDNATDDKPTTFGLKSNIDTYAPTKRNIDTFFNTALYNNEYMNGNAYGYGYGSPYGGYGMPYGQGYYGNPYAGGLNSNLVNREVLDNQINNNTYSSNENNQTKQEKKSKKSRQKRVSNVDTYNETTVQSNINTMGESKISKFFKEKFNNLRNKVRKQKDNVTNTDTQDNTINSNDIPNTYFDNEVIEPNNTPDLVDNINKNDNIDKELLSDNTRNDKLQDNKLNSTINNPLLPKQEKDIKAQ